MCVWFLFLSPVALVLLVAREGKLDMQIPESMRVFLAHLSKGLEDAKKKSKKKKIPKIKVKHSLF